MSYFENCSLCPRHCRINRYIAVGECGVDAHIRYANALLYKGEEPPISGERGTGAVFFSGCPLHCVYCQNFAFSQRAYGKIIDLAQLIDIYLTLQRKGAWTLELVTATQYAPYIVGSVEQARKKGLIIPVVWNTSGYETAETLDMLEATVDIYLTDLISLDESFCEHYIGAKHYPEVAKKAIKHMYEQKGNLQIDDEGRATKGLIVRMLVLPENANHIEESLRFLSEEISKFVYISVMDQYTPVYRASEFPKLSRKITEGEYERTLAAVEEFGFENGWRQMHRLSETLATKGMIQ